MRFTEILLSDFLRYTIAAGSAYLIFMVIWRRQWWPRKIQKRPVRRQQMWFEFRYSMSTVFIFAVIGWLILKAKEHGYTLIYEEFALYGTTWYLLSIVLMIVLHDAWFYWTHRLMHHPAIFRHVHLVHHRSVSPTPWAAYAFHPVEAVVAAGIFPLIVFTIPAHSSALLVFLIYMITRNVLGHLGIEIFPRWFIRNRWINWHTTTTHHDMHHRYSHANYGLYFTWWDKLCGTEHPNYTNKYDQITSQRNNPQLHTLKKSSSRSSATKALLVGMLIITFATYISGQVQPIEGRWQTFHEKSGLPLATIEIVMKEGSPSGTIKEIFLQPWEGEHPVCVRCPGRRQNQQVIGMQILWGFERKGTEWRDGKILDPVSGEIYSSKLWLTDHRTMKLRGFTGPFDLFHRTQTWSLHTAADDGNPVTGLWQQIDDISGMPKTLVEISESQGKLSGYVRKVHVLPWEGKDPVCRACPEPYTGKRIVGMTILSNFSFDGNKWTNGKILDPGNGNTYTSSMWLEDDNTLKVRGYWGPFFRTQIWKRSQNMHSQTSSPQIDSQQQ